MKDWDPLLDAGRTVIGDRDVIGITAVFVIPLSAWMRAAWSGLDRSPASRLGTGGCHGLLDGIPASVH